MSKLCILTVTTSLTSLGLMLYHQIYGFESFSSQTVNEAVNTFWSNQWSGRQVNAITLKMIRFKSGRRQKCYNRESPGQGAETLPIQAGDLGKRLLQISIVQ